MDTIIPLLSWKVWKLVNDRSFVVIWTPMRRTGALVEGGLPGSVHDTRVLQWSSVYVQQLYLPPGCCIIGDGRYPCLAAPISLMTPYSEPVQNPVRGRYNRHHSKAKCVVEKAIGMMKTQWRSIFLKALEVKSTFVSEVVSTCAFLHNLSITNGDLVEPDVEAAHGEDQSNQPEDQIMPGNNLRNRLAAEVSAPGAVSMTTKCST